MVGQVAIAHKVPAAAPHRRTIGATRSPWPPTIAAPSIRIDSTTRLPATPVPIGARRATCSWLCTSTISSARVTRSATSRAPQLVDRPALVAGPVPVPQGRALVDVHLLARPLLLHPLVRLELVRLRLQLGELVELAGGLDLDVGAELDRARDALVRHGVAQDEAVQPRGRGLVVADHLRRHRLGLVGARLAV